MIVVDGSFGEGGGQILRSSLTLSAVLGRPVAIVNIRAERPRPGLGNQHLAAAQATAQICKGELQGAKKGSRELVFRPGKIRAGSYAFDIGTAGSTTLVLQTILPALAFSADGPSTVTIRGGTHNPMAPPADYISECYLPALEIMGLTASCELITHGFYPKGGGLVRAEIEPRRKQAEPLPPLDLTAELDWGEPEVEILITNLPMHIAEREQNVAAKELGLDPAAVKIEPLDGKVGPGNAIMVRYRSGGRTALITSFGQKGKRAEWVALEAALEARVFSARKTAVDCHLADQLLLPMALGPGGSFVTSSITAHTRTQCDLLEIFLGIKVEVKKLREGAWKVTVPKAAVRSSPL